MPPRKVEEYSKHPLPPQSAKGKKGAADPLAIEGIECLEIFTENAKLTSVLSTFCGKGKSL
jgi:hypothetical protein